MKASQLWIAGLILTQTLSANVYAQDKYNYSSETLAKIKAFVEKAIAENKAKDKVAEEKKVQAKEEIVNDNDPNEVESPHTPDQDDPEDKDLHAEKKVKEEATGQLNVFQTFKSPAKPAPKPSPAPKTKFVSKFKQKPVSQPVSQGPIQFGFMHTKQDCKVAENGLLHKPTFCMLSDSTNSQELSGMVSAINAQLDTVMSKAATAKVSVAYFSFSNKGVQKKICELSRAGVSVRVFLDGGAGPAQIDPLIMANPECRDSQGQLNVKLSFLGGQTNGGPGGIWRLHHNKFLMVDPGDGGPVKLNFSSGNLSSFGTSLHLDHWVTMDAVPSSNIVRAHKCVMRGLESAAQVKDQDLISEHQDPKEADLAIANAYISERENCFEQNQVLPRLSNGNMQSQISEILKQEEIAPLFSPTPKSNYYIERSFISAINRIPAGGYLYIAIQHFLHGEVQDALVEASDRGIDVRIIMEDGALKQNESEVPGVDKVINSLIARTGGRIKIRLAETNHRPDPTNLNIRGPMMHNKLALLNGDMSFSGAGHYTNAAMRNNWENFYFVTNKTTLVSYAKYFKVLWDNSVDIPYTVSNGQKPSSTPATLAPAFLKLAQ